MDNAEKPKYRRFHELAFARRPAEELYDLARDPGQINNVAEDPRYEEVRARLRSELDEYLKETGDPRALGVPAPWDYYPYYGLRRNKDWQVDTPPADRR